MAREIYLVHQFDADLHDWLCGFVPQGSRVVRLPSDDPWKGPEGANVLMVGHGALRNLARFRPGWTENLEWVHLRPTGIDDAPDWLFDVPHVTVSRGASAVAIAEYVLAAILDFEKRPAAVRVTGHDGWSGKEVGTLSGRTLGLFGFGEIGRAVAERASGFGMRIIATTRTMGPSTGGAAGDIPRVPLRELCAQSDHLVLCAPLTDQTLGLFDATTFGFCRRGQHLVNVARGKLIEPEALRAALDDRIARATLDVWAVEPPPPGHWVYTHPRIVLTPHCASLAPSTAERLQAILEHNLGQWCRGRPDDMIGHVNRTARY
jgi:phosphoglycerate dehydrogenase-like enzyme